MPKLGVTGAAGYIGHLLSRTALAQGWEVRGVDDLTGPISLPPEGIPLVRADFSSAEALRSFEGVDAVAHLGAVSGVMPCANDPSGTRAVNVDGTARLIDWCRGRHVPVAFASSLAVVGVPARMPITEETPPAPTHEYARQKAEGEGLVDTLRRAGVPAAAVRMSNVYGSYAAGPRTIAKGNVLNEFARQMLSGHLRVNAPGTQRRDFIQIEDVIRGWLAVADRLRRGAPTEPTYLFASGSSASVLEIADRVAHAWRSCHPARPPLAIDVVDNPRGSIELLAERFEVDPSRTWASLGIRPAHRLSEDISRLVSSTGPERSD